MDERFKVVRLCRYSEVYTIIDLNDPTDKEDYLTHLENKRQHGRTYFPNHPFRESTTDEGVLEIVAKHLNTLDREKARN